MTRSLPKIVASLYRRFPLLSVPDIILVFFLFNRLDPLIHLHNSFDLDAIVNGDAKPLIHAWFLRRIGSSGMDQFKFV